MRLAESLVIPTELERARAAGELVIFAGAGVSMGRPAHLPGFKDLARQIAEQSIGWKDSDAEALDRYLGRAERQKGVDVQRRARMLLEVNRSHTPLHEYLLAIFALPAHIRLITTNFDPYFTSGAKCIFPGTRIPEYVGPALPPGKAFWGIARLHGALEQDQDRLVLTDRDFADAYMADGWASRFLVPLFEQRTVLFVGYSLTDPLMRYLLHAVPPTNRWFALWHQDEIQQGTEHEIVPVPFNTTEGGDRYGDLNDGLKRWAWHVRAPASDHERELQRLISLGPPASPLDADYVRARLATENGRLLFWNNAKDEAWFDWAVGEGLVDGLTDLSKNDTALAFWARWCLTNFSAGSSPPLLRFLRGRPLSQQPIFVAELVRHLWVTKDAIDPVVRRQLTAILVSHSNSSPLDPDSWEWLIEKYVDERHYDDAFALLRAASRPRLLPVDRLYLAYEERESQSKELPSLSFRIDTWVPADDLRRVVEKKGAELASFDADRLLMLGESQIVAAYELLDLARAANSQFDPLSFGRTSIAPSGQDVGSSGEDVLIAIMRPAIDELANKHPALLEATAIRYSNSKRALMRRLGLYALAKCDACSSDAVLDRAEKDGWPRDLLVRPELYLLLATHYKRATEEARTELTRALADDSWWGPDFDSHDEHARFSLSRKLLRDAPDSQASIDFAEAETLAHPEWAEGDPDGFLSRVEVGWGGQEASPIDSTIMLGWTPGNALIELRAVYEQMPGEGDNYNLAGAIQGAAKQNGEWAVALLELALITNNESDSRIAEAVLWGLRDAELSVDTKVRFLGALLLNGWTQRLTHPLAMALEFMTGKLGRSAHVRLLDAFESVADLIFVRSQAEAPAITDRGWTERSINHPAGHAAQIWWHAANARNWVGDQFVLSIADHEKARWCRVLQDDSAAGDYARPILGMVTDRLSAGDFPWAVEHVFPYFDPRVHDSKSAQLWDGRLMQHQWRWTTFEALRPYLDGLFAESATLIPARSRDLGDWTAMLVAGKAQSELSLVQLQAFIRGATEDARVSFADSLPRYLDQLEAGARRKLWHDLLEPYWRDRRTNVPIALTAAEMREMINWTIALPEDAERVLDQLGMSPGDHIEHADHILFAWTEDASWVIAHPTAAVRLIGFLVDRHSISQWSLDNAVAVISKAIQAGAERTAALVSAEGLVALGAPAASALIDQLRGEER
jgi:SIR2-like protein/uncharacterized protein DUF4020